MRSAATRGVASIFSIFFTTMILGTSVGAQSSTQTPQAVTPSPAAVSPVEQQGTPGQTGSAPAGNKAPQAAAAAPDQPPTAQEPTGQEPSGNDQGLFGSRKQIEEVVLHATVVDEQQHLVTGLDRSAFTVYEQGQAQTITSFRREDVPVELGIVVDNSGSMRDKRGQVNQAVINLIRASNPDDQVFVVNFGLKPYLDQDFTSDVNLLQAALHQVSAIGSTALYDAIVASAVHLKNAHLDKKVLLVITDGQDNMSQETLQEASQRLQQANG